MFALFRSVLCQLRVYEVTTICGPFGLCFVARVVGAMSARVEWKLAMRRQVSQISQTRAQEQKALELSRKMYDEEEEEEEVEMTDAETTGKSCHKICCNDDVYCNDDLLPTCVLMT